MKRIAGISMLLAFGFACSDPVSEWEPKPTEVTIHVHGDVLMQHGTEIEDTLCVGDDCPRTLIIVGSEIRAAEDGPVVEVRDDDSEAESGDEK